MAWDYTNDYSSTILAYTSGAGSITVVSVTGLPASGRYFILKVDDEYFLCTSYTGLILTVTGGQAGSTPANHSLGVAITGCWIVPFVLDGIRADQSRIGTYASLPTSGMKKGDQYKCTDYLVEFVYDGSVWNRFISAGSTAFPFQSNYIRGSSTITCVAPSYAGNILVVEMDWYSGTGNATVSDSAGTVYTRRTQVTGSSVLGIAIFTGVVPASPGVLTITATYPSGAGYTGFGVIELGGIAIADTVDVAASGSASATLITTTQPYDVIISAVGGGSNSGVTLISLGWFGLIGASNDSGGIQYLLLPTVGTINTLMYNSGGGAGVVYAVVALKTF